MDDEWAARHPVERRDDDWTSPVTWLAVAWFVMLAYNWWSEKQDTPLPVLGAPLPAGHPPVVSGRTDPCAAALAAGEGMAGSSWLLAIEVTGGLAVATYLAVRRWKQYRAEQMPPVELDAWIKEHARPILTADGRANSTPKSSVRQHPEPFHQCHISDASIYSASHAQDSGGDGHGGKSAGVDVARGLELDASTRNSNVNVDPAT